MCQELGITDIEYCNHSGITIGNISIQEWTDLNVKQFVEHQKLLSKQEKKTLSSYLKRCEKLLRL